jgi:glyoxylase-like metal-dependent hydrolase (beta-lactamase superfamily II)
MPGVDGILRLGDVEIVALRDSLLPLRLERMFPDVAADEFADFRRRYPGAFESEVWLAPVRAFVLRSRDWTVLFDTGIGTLSGFDARFATRAALADELAVLDPPSRLDAIVLSHIHLDHAGGVTRRDGGAVAAVFAGVPHYLHRADLELARGWAAESPAYSHTVLEVERLGLVAEARDGEALNDALHFLHTPGHTPGSTSLLLASRGEHAILPADVLPNPMLVTETDWRFTSDHEHARAVATRRAILERIEAEGLVVAATHQPEPFGDVVRVAGKRWWRGRG